MLAPFGGPQGFAGATRARASQAGWFWYQTLKSHSTLLTSAESCVAGLAGATGAIRADAPAARTTHRAIMAQIAKITPQGLKLLQQTH